MAGKYLLATLGCKVNQYESQQLREVLESCGLRPACPGDVPNIAVVNTCAVTAEASRKNRQTIRRLARGGRTPVVVVGCGAAANGAQLRALEGVTAVLGHDVNICANLRRLITRQLESQPTSSVGDANHAAVATHDRPDACRYEISMRPDTRNRGHPSWAPRSTDSGDIITPVSNVKADSVLTARIERFAGHQRAFLKVQDGCDASCTYCIVPRLRPQLRSKPIEVAVAEARDLVRSGHKEIIVTGIFLGAYGRNTAIRKRWGSQQSPLAALLDALAQVEGLRRLRLSSLEPGDVDGSLLDVLARHETCVPHLHLPLQSGSAQVLRRMNRQYTRDQFVDMIDRVRMALDRPAITTDIIVGFPGESEEDFRASLEIARYAEFCKIHAFPFSPREKTAAACWQKDFVDATVIRRRMRRLAELERECSLSFRRRFLTEAERVIVEGSDQLDRQASAGQHVRHGRADRYFEIHFEADDVRAGDLVPVRIDRVTPTRTLGTCLGANADSYPLDVLSTT
ncbi:MAG: MiaB/RimO family radical SAM methylthiotransferase [Phycisphaerales bacterium]|nr:MAG: MiaB/RimO family radical SAM methylthiotransferase [Phycisphaerales bacterium]